VCILLSRQKCSDALSSCMLQAAANCKVTWGGVQVVKAVACSVMRRAVDSVAMLPCGHAEACCAGAVLLYAVLSVHCALCRGR
jgi:hypothetical protein